MATNKVVFGGETVIDLTSDTLVSSDQLKKGIVAHTKDGNVITGTLGSNIDETIISFDTTNDKAKSYIELAKEQYPGDDTTTIIANYVDNNANNDKPNGYTINDLFDGTIYILDEDSGKSFKADCISSYTVYNLIPNHTYRYLNMNSYGVKNIGRIKDIAEIRMIKSDKALNVRDLGGRSCDGGTVKYGILYRGARLTSSSSDSVYLSENDKDLFRNYLNISYEIDMRTDDEVYDVNCTTSPIGANVKYERLAMNEAYNGGFKPTSSEKITANKIIETIMTNAINGVVTYFHCSAGADRTGTVATILNGVLGVSQLDLDIDYELTSLTPYDSYLRPRYATESYGKWYYDWKTYINGLGGDNPYITYCQQMGISIDLINSYRLAMIDGTPSDITGGESETNALSLAVDEYGNPYNDGLGYKEGIRLSSTGTESSQSDCFVTGFIPFTAGMTMRLENILLAGDASVAGYDYKYRISVYNNSKIELETKAAKELLKYSENTVIVDGSYITQFTLNKISSSVDLSDMAYIRISGILDGVPSIYIS